MSVIFVCVTSALSVFTLTWLKALAGGAQGVSGCSLKRSASRLRSCILVRPSATMIYGRHSADRDGTIHTNKHTNTYYLKRIQFCQYFSPAQVVLSLYHVCCLRLYSIFCTYYGCVEDSLESKYCDVLLQHVLYLFDCLS